MAERTLTDMMTDLKVNVGQLVTDTKTLAKEELSAEARKVGIGTVSVILALTILPIVIILLTISLGYGLVALGLAPWLAFLLDAVIFLLLAAGIGFFGVRRFMAIKPPERTKAAISGTFTAISEAINPTPSPTEDSGPNIVMH